MSKAARPMTSTLDTRPTIDDIRRAASRLAGLAHRTPVLTSRTANRETGAELHFKAETLQRAGAFKFRGAANAIAALDADARQRGVVTYSSGNHAQALAYAARLLGSRATIVMPNDAPAVKRRATEEYGGRIVTYDRYSEDRATIAAGIAAREGLALIPPFDHPDVMAGQGTVALELLEDVADLDLLLVPLGGGGLLSGCAIAARALNPAIRIVGVEPEAGNDGQQSFRAGHIVGIPVPHSIADGAVTTALGKLTFPVIAALVDDIVTVPDAALVAAMRFFAERMKLVVEPTGCLAAAAAFTGAVPVAGQRVGIVLSGGNVDLAKLGGFLA